MWARNLSVRCNCCHDRTQIRDAIAAVIDDGNQRGRAEVPPGLFTATERDAAARYRTALEGNATSAATLDEVSGVVGFRGGGGSVVVFSNYD